MLELKKENQTVDETYAVTSASVTAVIFFARQSRMYIRKSSLRLEKFKNLF